jgi:hypothetical protein
MSNLKVVENRVLRRMFGPRREEVIEGWRQLHSKELQYLALLKKC